MAGGTFNLDPILFDEKEFLDFIINSSYEEFKIKFDCVISLTDFETQKLFITKNRNLLLNFLTLKNESKFKSVGKITKLFLNSTLLNNKISAIKALKYLTGWPLTTSKQIIEKTPIEVDVPENCDFLEFKKSMTDYGFVRGIDYKFVEDTIEDNQMINFK